MIIIIMLYICYECDEWPNVFVKRALCAKIRHLLNFAIN